MNSDQILSLVRTLLTLAGSLAVAFGYVDATASSALQGEVLAAAGAILTAGSGIWGVWVHNHANQAAAAARSITAQPTFETAAPVAAALRDVGASVTLTALPTNAELAGKS